MTDPRFGEELLVAVRRLPIGSGVIFRHYQLNTDQRLQLFRAVRRICRQRGHVILLAGSEREAMRWRADGFHQRSPRRSPVLHSVAIHNHKELNHAKRLKTDMLMISPVFQTNSHPGQRSLGISNFNRLATQAGKAKIIALGGVTRQKARMLNYAVVHGWAAIDAFRKNPV